MRVKMFFLFPTCIWNNFLLYSEWGETRECIFLNSMNDSCWCVVVVAILFHCDRIYSVDFVSSEVASICVQFHFSIIQFSSLIHIYCQFIISRLFSVWPIVLTTLKCFICCYLWKLKKYLVFVKNLCKAELWGN